MLFRNSANSCSTAVTSSSSDQSSQSLPSSDSASPAPPASSSTVATCSGGARATSIADTSRTRPLGRSAKDWEKTESLWNPCGGRCVPPSPLTRSGLPGDTGEPGSGIAASCGVSSGRSLEDIWRCRTSSGSTGVSLPLLLRRAMILAQIAPMKRPSPTNKVVECSAVRITRSSTTSVDSLAMRETRPWRQHSHMSSSAPSASTSRSPAVRAAPGRR
mmetsp:Transcript_30671/g.72877  ORF Transcript_30671/g.72877 Transcript_30671/m.72877 type:complete len:217 (-) Transcript_30671:713-1363(-)